MIISYTALEEKVRSMIKPKRFIHSEGVASVSADLASRFGMDVSAARYIGIYHDAYRYSASDSSPEFCRKNGIDVFPEEEADPMLLHGALAAIHFDEDAEGSVPEYFRRAVRHHTLGSPDMGPYGAVVYIADYIEPGRKHLTDDDRKHILSADTLEDMIIRIMDMQRSYFIREGIKEAGISGKLYDFIKGGGRL